MDFSCLEVIIGSAASGLGVGYAAGFQLGKTRVSQILEVPCSVLVEEVTRLSKKHTLKLKPNKLQTHSIGGKVVQVSCHKLNNKTSKCQINNKKCILLS